MTFDSCSTHMHEFFTSLKTEEMSYKIMPQKPTCWTKQENTEHSFFDPNLVQLWLLKPQKVYISVLLNQAQKTRSGSVPYKHLVDIHESVFSDV